MKKILTAISLIFILSSCDNHQFTLVVSNGEGWSYTESWVECDSFQMISSKEAYIIVDNKKMKIISTRGIRPISN